LNKIFDETVSKILHGGGYVNQELLRLVEHISKIMTPDRMAKNFSRAFANHHEKFGQVLPEHIDIVFAEIKKIRETCYSESDSCTMFKCQACGARFTIKDAEMYTSICKYCDMCN